MLALCFIELTSRPPPAGQRRAAARAVAALAVLALAFAGGVLTPVATVGLLVALLLAELAFELVTLTRSSPA